MLDCVKAIRIKFALKRLQQAKLRAYRKSIGLEEEEVNKCSVSNIFKIILCRVCCFCLQFKVRGKYTAIEFILLNGTLPNKIAKSILGFSFGLASIYLFKFTLIEYGNVTPSKALYISIPVGIVLAIGLAFSQCIRMFCLLIVPQIFTSQVRILILGSALTLSMSGPGKNYIENLKILTTCLHCTMHMLNEAFRDLLQIVKDPLSVVAKFFAFLKQDIEKIFGDFKETFNIVKGAIVDIANFIKEGFNWLKGITEICNVEIGTPYDRCKIEFKAAVIDCTDKLGDAMSFMCHVDALDDLCELTKVVDFFCTLPTLIKVNIFQPIEKELDKMLDIMKEFFDVRIHVAYHFDIDLNSSKTVRQVLRDIKGEILQEIHWIIKYFTNFNVVVLTVFILMTVLSAVWYRYWYLHLDRHDNKYVTRGMIYMDEERRRLGKETLFPLQFNEVQLYIQACSLKMFKNEKKKFKRDFLLVLLSSVPILLYVLLDLGLYILLMLIRKYGVIVTDFKDLDIFEMVNVTGEGFMADIDRAVLKALKPLHDALPVLDNRKCLPDPSRPNHWQHISIVLLLILCIILTCTEAYGLRLGHIICGMYYPERQVYRDRWLYVHILSSRGSFFKYAKNQIMAKLTGDDLVFRVSLRQRLINTCPCGRKLFWFLETTKKQCFLCGRDGDMEDYVNFHHCPTCNSVYCLICFDQVAQKCPVCMKSMDSDVSIDEESGSPSEDEDELDHRPLLRLKNVRKRFRNLKKDSDTSSDEDETKST